MAVNTVVRVGWDATAVKAGMTALRGAFSGVFRGFRQVGIGAARQVGAQMTDLLGRVVMAIPSGIKETMDWAGNLTDMSAQTGVAVSKLVLMEEALRLAGASANDTSRIISTLASNLNEARDAEGPAREALNKLGFLAEDFANVPIDKAFEMIGKKAASLPKDFRGLENIMADLFGARMGFKLIRFFRDFDGGMRQAENNVGKFANRLDATAGGYDQMSDALGRFQMRWRETMSILIDQANGVFGTDWIDQMFDKLSPEKLRQTLIYLREAVSGVFSGEGISGMVEELGRKFGEGIVRGSLNMDPRGTSGGIMKGLLQGLLPQAKNDNGLSTLISQGAEQTGYLRRIADKKGGWA
jgi:hypothetical protein